MTSAATPSGDHSVLMDSIYRSQRHFYDATRKYFLFGRDRLIEELDLSPGGSVLEIACGTGRNLARIAQRWPETELFGLDISSEMLKSAERKLGRRATVALGDATGFDPVALFGRERFDRVVLSFAASMIPDWHAALAQAAGRVGPDGSLHIVDFGEMDGFPAFFRAGMNAWLSRFHVSPRPDLAPFATQIAARHGFSVQSRRGRGGYYTLVVLRDRPAP